MARTWTVARSMFWVVPSVFVAASIGAAVGLVSVDTVVGTVHASFLYPGDASGARSFLSAIVESMITVTGTVFSVSVVALQLANGQFSSRIIRVYLRDLVVQCTLGLFMATFVYSMVVMRSVAGRSGGAHSFVPRIAITVAFALVVASVALFIEYISHISNLLRVATLVTRVGEDSRRLLERRYPFSSPSGPPLADLAPEVGQLPARRPGVVVSVNEARLVKIAAEANCTLVLAARVGDFVPTGAPLFRVHSGAGPALRAGGDWTSLAERAARAVVQDTERSMEQDLAFGFRQLVDIAEKALSPALNDPTTATQCLDVLHDLLRRLAVRPLPDGCRLDGAGEIRLVVPQYSFSDFLDVALVELWRYGQDATQVPSRVRELLADLAEAALPEYRAPIECWQRRVGVAS